MCPGVRRDSSSKKRHLHFHLHDFLLIVRPRTGGRMNSVTDATSSSTTWKVTHAYIFPKTSATCHRSGLPPLIPSLLLKGNNCDSLWFLLQIQRSKVKCSTSATTNRPSTGMMKQPRWQECGDGRERVADCRLGVLTRRGGSGLATSFLGSGGHSSSLLSFSCPISPA